LCTVNYSVLTFDFDLSTTYSKKYRIDPNEQTVERITGTGWDDLVFTNEIIEKGQTKVTYEILKNQSGKNMRFGVVSENNKRMDQIHLKK